MKRTTIIHRILPIALGIFSLTACTERIELELGVFRL